MYSQSGDAHPHQVQNLHARCASTSARLKPTPLTAAERDWLQEEEIPFTRPHPQNLSPTARFDWRLRASSRAGASNGLNGESQKSGRGYRKYISRKLPPYIDVGVGEKFYEEIQAYQRKFLPPLAAEQAEDEAVLKERLSSWSLTRLQEEGYCLADLSAFWLQANQFGRPVAAFMLGPGITLPEHRFENGTQVLISRVDPLKEQPVHGSVVSRTDTQVRVSFEEPFDAENGPWRLDIGNSNIVYQRMRAAIRCLNHDPKAQELFADGSDVQLILQGTHLRDVLLRGFPSPPSEDEEPRRENVLDLPRAGEEQVQQLTAEVEVQGGAFKDDMRVQSWAERHARADPIEIEGDPVLEGLNASQKRAVAMMIKERVSLVQGPPGTGKTKTIIETIKLLKVHFEVPQPLLVCTYTNVAVDNLVEGLAAAGVKPLRVAFGGKVKNSLLEHTLDYKLDQHPLKPKVVDLEKRIEGIQKDLKVIDDKHPFWRKEVALDAASREEGWRRRAIMKESQLRAMTSKMYALRQQMLRDVLSNADVICTTCITSACVALNVVDFPVVFLDEASMSTEPASLIPIMKGSRHLALIGDHKQLPPVITSREAQAMGLGVSLFERLTDEGVVPSMMLDVQYRMHPAISRFPSLEFYDLSLHDGTVDSTGHIASCLLPPASRHLPTDARSGNRPSVVFLDHAGSETMKDRSRVNWNEGYIVCGVIEDLLLNNPQLRGEDIGVIAPYVAQISLLTRLLNTDNNYRKRFKSVLGDHRAMQLGNIEIKTVDGFEGREKDIIIFSTVRNNSGGHIGFLADRRRLNVGLTRAKRGLFVVGSMSTLRAAKISGGQPESPVVRAGKGAESWRRYAEYLTEQQLVLQLSGESLKVALYGDMGAQVDARRMLVGRKSSARSVGYV